MGASLEDMVKERGIPPRDVVFNEPWEARAFALALALAEAGRFEWEEFRQRLIAEIASSDAAVAAGEHGAATYYEAWLRALEALVGAKGIARIDEIDRSAGFIAAHPPEPTRAVSRGPVKIA